MLSAEEIYKILLTAYGKPRWWSDDPFTVMFQSVLVQNTAWSSYQPTFIIDAYTRRFLLRLGYEFSDDTAIKNFFETGLKKDAQLYGWYHWLILEHCISVCKKSPDCDKCKFKEQCKYSLQKEK